MKIREVLLDAATVAGCCIGVGFVSGKEQQLFFGNVANVVLFSLLFLGLNTLVREFARKNGCFDVDTLFASCFGKSAGVFATLFYLCCFVCVVTMLAGVENCLKSFLWEAPLPLYGAVCAAISAVVLKKGLKALKILNMVSVALTLAYFVLIGIFTQSSYLPVEVSPIEPVKYALFSLTMSLGVLTPLSNTKKKNNITATAVATLCLSLLIVAVLFLGDFSLELPMIGKTNSLALNLFGALCMVLATVTGVVANALPATRCVSSLFEDDSLCFACFFGLALALSMFGFDFALKYGYLFVAVVGTLLIGVLLFKTAFKRLSCVRRENCRKNAKKNAEI